MSMLAELRNYGNAALTRIVDTHNWAKTIDQAHFGHYYTIISDNIDYYVVEKTARPALGFIVDQYRKHPLIYSAGLLLLVMFLAHPNRPSKPDADKPSNGAGPAGSGEPPATPLKRRNSDPMPVSPKK